MHIEEWVLYELEKLNWDANAAHQSLADGLGKLNPPLEYYQRQCAQAAKERWRRTIQEIGINHFAERENDVIVMMGPLLAFLQPDDAEEVRLDEERRYRILHPRQFLGFKKK